MSYTRKYTENIHQKRVRMSRQEKTRTTLRKKNARSSRLLCTEAHLTFPVRASGLPNIGRSVPLSIGGSSIKKATNVRVQLIRLKAMQMPGSPWKIRSVARPVRLECPTDSFLEQELGLYVTIICDNKQGEKKDPSGALWAWTHINTTTCLTQVHNMSPEVLQSEHHDLRQHSCYPRHTLCHPRNSISSY